VIRERAEVRRLDVSLVGAAAATGFGMAIMLGVSAAAAGVLAPAVVGGTIFAISFVSVVALGWVRPLPLLVLTLPLPALYSTEEFRLPLVLFLAALVVLGWFLGRARDRRPLFALPAAMRPFLALLGAVVLAAIFADEIVPAVRETANFLLFVGLFAVALDAFATQRDAVDSCATWIAVAAAGAGIAAVMETLGLLPGRFPLAGTGFFRAAGGFGWPNELAMFLAVASPWVVYRLRVARGTGARLFALVALGALGLGLAATFSRGSWLAITLSPAVLLLVGRWRFALAYWGVLLLAVLVVDVGTGGALSTRVVGTAQDALVAQRLLLTGAGLLMFQSSPVVGVGPGGFGDALEAFGPQISGLFDFVGSAHNGYVHVAAEMGVVGLFAFLFLVVSTWVTLFRGARRARHASDEDGPRRHALLCALLWSFTAACIVSGFEWPFAHGVGELIVLVAAAGHVLARGVATGPAEGRFPSRS
jgi:O-antigen ligase